MSTAGKEAAKKPEDQKVVGSDEQDRPPVSDADRRVQKDPNDRRVVDPDEADTTRVVTRRGAGDVDRGVALGVAGEEYYEYYEHEEYDEYGEPIETQSELPVDNPAFHVGVIGGYGVLTGNEINGYPIFGLVFGATSKSDRFGAEIRGLLSFPRLTDATEIAEGVEGEEQLAIDGAIRWYTTPIHTFVGFCFMGGLRWGMLNWQYKNPIEYNDGFGNIYEISGDQIQFLTPYLGVGLNLMQTRHFVLGADLTGGYKFYKWNTEEGFDNDVLDDEWVAQLLMNVSFVFGR